MIREASQTARLHAIFEGRVQGVGFRYAVQRIARRLGVRGWVRNLASGEVELVGEGPREALEQLLEECRRGAGTAGHVRRAWTQWEEPEGAFTAFEIRPDGPSRPLLERSSSVTRGR
jgi:acylphosphatase